MFRKVLATVGAVEVVAPASFVDAAEGFAMDDAGDCERKSWVVPVARVEGLAFLFLAWRGDASYSAFKKFLGLVGALALAFPRAFVDYSTGLAYTDAADCEWRPWVYPVTRLVGAVYVLLALDELREE